MKLHPRAADLVKSLDLSAHVEGGHYRRVYSGKHTFLHGQNRSICTSIYYVLNGKEVSKFHRLRSDELWFFHEGSPFEIHGFLPDGTYMSWMLGSDLESGELPQVVIPAGTIFGSHLVFNDSYGFVSCVVSPGFDFQDFEIMSRDQLLSKFPDYIPIIKKLT